MKYTKIITSLFVAAAFMFGSSAMAADKEKGKGKGGRKNPLAELGLSKDQMAQVKELNKTRTEAFKKARDAKDRDAMRAAGQAYAKGLAKILNEEQMEKFKKLQAEMRKNRGSKGKGDSKSKGKGKKKKKDS